MIYCENVVKYCEHSISLLNECLFGVSKKKKKLYFCPPLTLCPSSVPANSNMQGDGHAKCGCDNISVNNKREWKMENVGMVENVLISQK